LKIGFPGKVFCIFCFYCQKLVGWWNSYNHCHTEMCKNAVKRALEEDEEVNRLNNKNNQKFNQAFLDLGLKYLIVV